MPQSLLPNRRTFCPLVGTTPAGPRPKAPRRRVERPTGIFSAASSSTGAWADLRKVLPAEASIRNPVDTTASGQPEHFGQALRLVAKDPNVDAIIVLFVSPVMIDGLEVARNITKAVRGSSLPVMSCFMGKHRAEEGIAELRRGNIPVFRFPEEAAHALASMNRYREIQKRPRGKVKSFPVDRESAAKIIARAKRKGRTDLRLDESQALLEAYGVPFAPSRLVGTPAEAIEFGSEVGYPIVLKAVSEAFSHKTDLGGVVLDLRNGDEAAAAWRDLDTRMRRIDPEARIQAQKMIPGREVILGVADDPQFGPLLLFGLGGIYVEILEDVSVRVHPITDRDADEMIRSTRGYPLLAGVRGEKAVDLAAPREMILRISQLISDFPQIRELDVNPFIVARKRRSSAAVDARVTLHGDSD